MATTDTNGILFYETTDPVSPLNTLLNSGQQSVSDAVGALKTADTNMDTRVDSLETDTGWVNLSTSGVTNVACQYRRIDRVVYFRAEFYNVTGAVMCTLPVGYRPPYRFQLFAPRILSPGSSFTTIATGYFATDGTVTVGMLTGSSITSAPGYSLTASWPIN